MEDVTLSCADFWKELLKKNDFNANSLNEIGSQIILMNLDITRLVETMLEINPHHGYLLRIYALFL